MIAHLMTNLSVEPKHGLQDQWPMVYIIDGLDTWARKNVGMYSSGDHTAIEFVGRDCPNLLF